MNEQYEVYPGKPPDSFLQEFFQSKQLTIEAFCKNERISSQDFSRLAKAVIVEWGIKEETHPDRKTALYHLINHIRSKYQHEQRNNAIQQRFQSSGRGQHRNPTAYDLASEILGCSAN